MNPLSKVSLGAVLAAAVGFSGSAHSASDDPVKIPIHNWSSQIVGAHIVGKILNQAGFKTEFISSDSQVVYTSMCEGDIHLVHEVWQGAFGVAFEKVVKEGCVIDAATTTRRPAKSGGIRSTSRKRVPACRTGRRSTSAPSSSRRRRRSRRGASSPARWTG